MQNFELLRNVTIGQYIPTGSPVHRLDPRAKILAAIFLILAVSFNRSIVANALFLAVVLAITGLSQIPLRYMLRGFVLGLPVLVLIFATQFLFLGRVDPPGYVFAEWGWLRVTQYQLQLMAISAFRITSFIFLTSLVTMTATTTELTHGVESLLAPLRRFGVPSHELALILMITLRFVPVLAEEMERIMKAQASRGAEFGTRRFWRPDRAARAYLPLVVPLFLNAFQRAEELVLAMEARCYVSGGTRTKFVQLRGRWVDVAVVMAALAFMGFMVLFPWPPVSDWLRAAGIMR